MLRFLHVSTALLFAFVFLAPLLSQAQDVQYSDKALRFESVQLLGGMYGNLVPSIAQDPQGFMWFGGRAGLNRYDGYELKNYRNDPADSTTLSADWAEYIYVDREGSLWVGTFGGGLNRFDPVSETFTHYHHDPGDPTSLSSDTVQVILQDRSDMLWVGTHSGLNRFDPITGTVTRYLHNEKDLTSLSDDHIRSLYEDRSGTLWVGTWEGGLNRFNAVTETFTRYQYNPDDPTSLSSNWVMSLYEDAAGRFWVGTMGGDGLHTMDREAGTFIRHRYDLADPDKLGRPYLRKGFEPGISIWHPGVRFIHEDHIGRRWIGGFLGGLDRYDPISGNREHYELEPGNPNSLGSDQVWTIHESRDGTIWIGTWEGLFKAVPAGSSFRHYAPSRIGNETVEEVRTFLEDQEGRVGIGTLRGLYLRNRVTETFFVLNTSLVMSSHEDRKGTWWIGTWEGLCRLDSPIVPGISTCTWYRSDLSNPDSLSSSQIYDIVEGQTGTLWVGTDSGLNRFDPQTKTNTRFLHSPDDPYSISSNRVRVLYEDRMGVLWVGTRDGLNRLDHSSGTFMHYLTGRWITSIHEDRYGRFWIGTDRDGLVQLDRVTGAQASFSSYNSSLPDNRVACIAEGEGGDLWLGTATGLSRFDPDENTFQFYAGLEAVPFVRGACYRSQGGKLFFGGENGFHTFFPKEVQAAINPSPPQVAVTGFRLFREPVQPGASSPLKTFISQAEEIILSHDQNVFSFDFVALHYRNPEGNRVLFMLEGYDDDWRAGRLERSVTYVKVPPGRYTFRIKAFSSDGVMNAEGASIKVTVHPPWWKTVWAYALYALLLTGLVVGVYRVQHARIVRREREQAQIREAELRAEAAELQAKATETQARVLETEHERDRIELEKAHGLEVAYNQLKTTQAQLIQSEKMASLGQLTSGIAHELKNPLNFVNNFAEVNEELTVELREALKQRRAGVKDLLDDLASNARQIVRHGKRADRIVKNMMEHAHDASGERYDVGVNKLVEEYAGLAYHGMRAQMPGLDVEIERHLDASVGNVEMAPQELGRALLAILNNALEAVHKKAQGSDGDYKPAVKVVTRQVDGQVEIRVCDNGPGIPEHIHDHIFEPFFTTKPTGSGTGLGLSLAYDIVTQGHGGTLTVESEEGKGATFVITLPATQETR